MNPVKDLSFQFAIAVIETTRNIQKNHRDITISKQLLRSGTSVGALYTLNLRQISYINQRSHRKSVMQPAIG
ncbi:four helix bundle protein [Robertkochia aurantiaca]|uniref:four helix bundle protein n=1 Tax=Robertkochia aurantiaca TaxID=2873700 RepID=UPI0021033282|nr:four helix bundle protein [Robertkochia sp. 3YJGBD-33]